MAYKTVRRNGRDVLINTITGKEVQPGERVANELKRFGSTINKNFTYSDKVNPRTGQRLTPAEVEAIEKPKSKPKVKVTNPVKSKQLTADEARTPKVEAGKSDPEFRRPKPAEKQPAKPVMRTAQQPTTATKASAAKPAEKPKAPVSTASTYRDPSDTKGLSVGRYRTLEEHRAAVQANKAMKIGSKFDKTMDVYTPSTKMEGKEMDTSKVTAKTEEYNKKKRKNLK